MLHIVFGGWDIFEDNAYESALKAGVLRKEHLVKYYVMTRPIGWWKPVEEEARNRGLIK